MSGTGSGALDHALLHGFVYRCRPECGLCCYAEPRVEPAEKRALLQIAPATPFVETGPASYVRSHDDGGACQLLRDRRCVAWAARPGPCQQFPVTVHVAERVQASLVLSCPGIELAGLASAGPWSLRPPPVGLEREMAAATRRLEGVSPQERAHVVRRRRRCRNLLDREGRWMDEEEVREALRRRVPLPERADFPCEEPPTVADGLEHLPLFFDGRAGPVALAAGLGGWEVRELRAEGGSDLLGVVPPPATPPEITSEGRRLLTGYLGYFLERDALFGAVVPTLESGDPTTVLEAVSAELRAIGALVMSRADVRKRGLRGESGPLAPRDLEDGIRATDQDLLDRPTWGFRL